MDVYWLEQSEGDVPCEQNWMSSGEVTQFESLRFAKRRADWRLGRWTAKKAIAAYLKLPSDASGFRQIEINASESGAPEVCLASIPSGLTISISHREGVAVCAVAPSGEVLGCDLEIAESRSDAFIADYLTTAEQELIAAASDEDRPWLVSLLWSGKESVFKALRVGLRVDARSVSIIPRNTHDLVGLKSALPGDTHQWYPLEIDHVDNRPFQGWWQREGRLLRTLVTGAPQTVNLWMRCSTCAIV